MYLYRCKNYSLAIALTFGKQVDSQQELPNDGGGDRNKNNRAPTSCYCFKIEYSDYKTTRSEILFYKKSGSMKIKTCDTKVSTTGMPRDFLTTSSWELPALAPFISSKIHPKRQPAQLSLIYIAFGHAPLEINRSFNNIRKKYDKIR